MKYVFSAKIWFMKTSSRIMKYESQVVKSNPEMQKVSISLKNRKGRSLNLSKRNLKVI